MLNMFSDNLAPVEEVDITIAVHDRRWHGAIPNVSVFCERMIRHVLKSQAHLWYRAEWKDIPLEVACVMTNNSEIQQLNLRFRGKDAPTNVLSFEADPDGPHTPGTPRVLGDVIISLETLIQESLEQKKTLQDHTAHMLIHGTLHLLGLDHQKDQEADAMEKLEIEMLSAIGIANPYQTLPSA